MEDLNQNLNESGAKRKRSAKITSGQYQIYLDELQKNDMFRVNKYNPKKPDILDETWESLALKLNAAGGPRKTVQQWKERLADWKCNVRKKARKLELARTKTGGGPPEIPLSECENRLLDLTGRAVVKGLEEIPELGVDDDPPVVSVRPSTPQVTLPSRPQVTPSAMPTEKKKQPSSQKQQQKKVTLATSVRTLVENDTTTTNHLKEISQSLKTLVKLKQKEILIAEITLKLQYPDTEFELLDDDSE